MSTAADLAARTPADRDRYVDLVRAVSIGVVVLGHWLMAVVTWSADGLRTDNALAAVPWLWWATWVLQVMPVFFMVGGFSNRVALDGHQRRGGTWAGFLHGRLTRLLRPTAVFVGVWLALAAASRLTGVGGDSLALGARVVAQPLWFLAVYVTVVALAPALLAAHRRFGTGVPVALAGAAAAVDVARLAGAPSLVGYLNYPLVFLFAHQLGFFYGPALVARAARLAPVLSAAGLGGLVLLTAVGPYPVSMVGVSGQAMSNMSPPTVCIVALAMWQAGLVLALRAPVARWLARPRRWTAVVAANGVIMTVFLWHLTALVGAVAVLSSVGLPQPVTGSPGWWALRPVWVLVPALALAGLVVVAGRFERPRPVRPSAAGAATAGCSAMAAGGGCSAVAAGGGRTARAAAGVLLAVAGLAGLALGGFGRPWGPVSAGPLLAAAALAGGHALVAGSAGQRRWPGAAIRRSSALASRVVASLPSSG